MSLRMGTSRHKELTQVSTPFLLSLGCPCVCREVEVTSAKTKTNWKPGRGVPKGSQISSKAFDFITIFGLWVPIRNTEVHEFYGKNRRR